MFVNFKGRPDPYIFTVPDDFTLGPEWKGGFLKTSDGRQLYVALDEVLTAYVIPNMDGQTLGWRK